jgi:DNA-binding NarL/FixJ family response regulator
MILSAFFDRRTINQAVEAGVLGYISKNLAADMICDAIVKVARGETVMSEEAQKALADQVRKGVPAQPEPELSPREQEVLRLTAEDHSAAEVAASSI